MATSAPVSTPSTPSAPSPAPGETSETRRTRHVDPRNLKNYLHRLAKGLHPDLHVSADVITAVNQILLQFNHRVVSCADRICEYSGFNTLSLKELRVAVLSFMPHELIDPLNDMTTETVTRYDRKLLDGPKRQRRKPTAVEAPTIAPEPAPVTEPGSQSAPGLSQPTNGRREVVSRSTKAALTVAVARIDTLLRETSQVKRLGAGSPVYFAAVLEYVAGDLLNLAGLVTKELNVRTTKLPHLVKAIKEDSAYRQLCADWLLCLDLGISPPVTLGPESEGDTVELDPSITPSTPTSSDPTPTTLVEPPVAAPASVPFNQPIAQPTSA
jgi:histone H2A